MFLRVLQLISRFLLRIIAHVEIHGLENVPTEGAAIVVSNHLGRLDAMLGVVLTHRHDFILMAANKYEQYPLWRWFGKKLDIVWIDRDEADLRAMRVVSRRLQAGQILAIAPEGTRSKDEVLARGKPGAAFLAARAKAPIVPIGLSGTEDREVAQRLRSFRRLDIRISIGPAFMLPPMDRNNREAYLEKCTEEIMCRIAVQLPPQYRGYYADNPRLRTLEAELASMAPHQRPADAGDSQVGMQM